MRTQQMNAEQLVEVWLGLREYFNEKMMDTIAAKYVAILVDNGVQDQALKDSLGEDPALDLAISDYMSDCDDDDEPDYDED